MGFTSTDRAGKGYQENDKKQAKGRIPHTGMVPVYPDTRSRWSRPAAADFHEAGPQRPERIQNNGSSTMRP